MATVYEWKVYCTTDLAWYSVLSEGVPSVCPSNAAHAIDGLKSYITRTISENTVTVKEEVTPTQGYFACKSFGVDAVASTDTDITISFKHPIGALAVHMMTRADQEGDRVIIDVSPDTIIGALRANVAIGDTVIPVTATVTTHAKLGFRFALFDGVNTNHMGVCTAVDPTPGSETITMETATTHAFSAASPTYVRLSVRMMDVEIGPGGPYSFGESKIGASYVPANTPVRLRYTNNTVSNKRATFTLDYLY